MILRVVEIGDGLEISGPTGDIRVYLEPEKHSGEVHIKGPGENVDDVLCRVHGNTYENKSLIKKLPYGRRGTQWSGETWTVHKDMTTELCSVLKIAGVDVTIEAAAVAEDSDWGHLREELEIGEGSDETLTIMCGPSDPGEKVSRSWAENAAETGGYDSAEEFAHSFNLEIGSDEEMKRIMEDADSSDGADVFSSE